jgi:hypothetical protein
MVPGSLPEAGSRGSRRLEAGTADAGRAAASLGRASRAAAEAAAGAWAEALLVSGHRKRLPRQRSALLAGTC